MILNSLLDNVYTILILKVLCILVILKCSHWAFYIYKCLKNLPTPKSIFLFGNFFEFENDTQQVFEKIRAFGNQFKTNYKLRIFNIVTVNLLEPDDIEIILSDNHRNEKSVIYHLLRPWLKTGLLTSEGEKWHTRRKILTPTFHFNILLNFSTVFAEHSTRMISQFDSECDKPFTDIVPYVTEFTLHSLCETTMGLKVDSNVESVKIYKSAILKFGDIVVKRLLRPWHYNDTLFNLSYCGFVCRKVVKQLHKFTTDIIRERLDTWDENEIKSNDTASGKKRLAMLDLLISQMKNGANITYDGIREEVDTFMFEGHDTTSMGICFTLLELADNKFAQDRIVEELDEIFGDSNRPPTFQDLQSMVYLEKCLKEALRLHPPVPFISRQATQDLKLKNVTIPSGVYMHIHIYDLHRNSKYWPNPEKFDPERFSPDNVAKRHPFLYLPFSAGSRNCIGQKFALLELKAFISTILRNFILEPYDHPNTIPIIADLVLRPKNGIRIKFRRRNKQSST